MKRIDIIRLIISTLLCLISLLLLVVVFYNSINIIGIYKILSIIFYLFCALNLLFVSREEPFIFYIMDSKKVLSLDLPVNIMKYDVIPVETLSKIKSISKRKGIQLICYEFNEYLVYYYLKDKRCLYLYKQNAKNTYKEKIKQITA